MNKFYLKTLNHDKVSVKTPIPVVFSWHQDEGDRYVMMNVEGVNINSSGDTMDEAISFLQEMIVHFAIFLAETPEERCGKAMNKIKRFLAENVQV